MVTSNEIIIYKSISPLAFKVLMDCDEYKATWDGVEYSFTASQSPNGSYLNINFESSDAPFSL